MHAHAFLEVLSELRLLSEGNIWLFRDGKEPIGEVLLCVMIQ